MGVGGGGFGSTDLRGVRGLPMIRRGERIFGSKENFSLMFSRTDGATYVKPWKDTETLVRWWGRTGGGGEEEEEALLGRLGWRSR